MKPEYITRTYGIREWTDHVDFLEQYGTKIGKLLKVRLPMITPCYEGTAIKNESTPLVSYRAQGGEPDINAAAKLVLHDFQRGRWV